MANVTGRIHVAPPTYRPAVGGIFSVAPLMDAQPEELAGVVYESESCDEAHYVALDPESCLETEEKDFDPWNEYEEGEPFHIYASKACTLFGNANFEAFAEGARVRLERGRESLIEQHLWDVEFRRGVDLTPEDGAVDVVTALGILEAYASLNYNALPIVHAGKRLAVKMAAEKLLTSDGRATRTGSDFVNGAGYFSDLGPLLHYPLLDEPYIGASNAQEDGGSFVAGTYFWTMSAFNEGGEQTALSNEVTATVVEDGSVEFEWSSVEGATSYRLWRSTVSGVYSSYYTIAGDETSYTDTFAAFSGATIAPDENGTGGSNPTEANEGEVWLYITGAVMLRGGQVFVQPAQAPQTNKLIALAEQTIVPTVDCLVAAIRVELE